MVSKTIMAAKKQSLKFRIKRLITACNLSRDPSRMLAKAYVRIWALRATSPHLNHLAYALQCQRLIVLARQSNEPLKVHKLTRRRDHYLSFYGF